MEKTLLRLASTPSITGKLQEDTVTSFGLRAGETVVPRATEHHVKGAEVARVAEVVGPFPTAKMDHVSEPTGRIRGAVDDSTYKTMTTLRNGAALECGKVHQHVVWRWARLTGVLLYPAGDLPTPSKHVHARLELGSVHEHASWCCLTGVGTIQVGNTGNITPRALKGAPSLVPTDTRGVGENAPNGM